MSARPTRDQLDLRCDVVGPILRAGANDLCDRNGSTNAPRSGPAPTTEMQTVSRSARRPAARSSCSIFAVHGLTRLPYWRALPGALSAERPAS